MNHELHDDTFVIVQAVVDVLSSPRDRYHRPIVPHDVRDRIRNLLVKYQAPNGGLDCLDQCLMLLQPLVNEPVRGVLDMHR